MGVVYRARDRLYGEVALKQLRVPEVIRAPAARAPHAGFDSTLPQSYESSLAGFEAATRTHPVLSSLTLMREFHTLASLRHPHIIEVFDYGFDAERNPFYTMAIQRDAEPITTAAAAASFETKVGLLAQLLRATRYLHRSGVLHGDLKPSNVLVVESDAAVKVSDFGMRPTSDGPFVAPELLRGGSASERSDMYALGAIIHLLALGQPPGPSGASLGRAAPLLGAMVARLTAPDPDDRFDDWEDVLGGFTLAMPRSQRVATLNPSSR